MGNVKDRYIHYKKAGDQFCGRSVTGILSLCKEFAVSPEYFELGSAPPEIENEINRRIKNICEWCFTGTIIFTGSIFCLLPFAFITAI